MWMNHGVAVSKAVHQGDISQQSSWELLVAETKEWQLALYILIWKLTFCYIFLWKDKFWHLIEMHLIIFNKRFKLHNISTGLGD